jgi:hypothetical protein
MAPVEEAGKVATSVVESLKSQPLAIALIVINILFLLGVGYLLRDLSERQATSTERKDALIADMMKKAYECAMPSRRSNEGSEP